MRASTGDSMMIQPHPLMQPCRQILRSLPLFALSGCAALGSMMSPYSEKFSCKNSDHGQCIHPEKAWADAVAGRPSKSDPAVTNDRKLLVPDQTAMAVSATVKEQMPDKSMNLSGKPKRPEQGVTTVPAKPGSADTSGLAVGNSTPMLKPSRTLRTLILPYADRQRPDRLYMARYIYSIIDRPAWVVGDYLVEPGGHAPTPHVLRSMRDKDALPEEARQDAKEASALLTEPRQ